jgi:hypothetical protein
VLGACLDPVNADTPRYRHTIICRTASSSPRAACGRGRHRLNTRGIPTVFHTGRAALLDSKPVAVTIAVRTQ